MAGVGVLFLWLASVAPAAFLSHFTVFVLACVVGYYVVWNVSHALHTPLMAVTNAISGIIIVGALLQIRQPTGNLFIDALALWRFWWQASIFWWFPCHTTYVSNV